MSSQSSAYRLELIRAGVIQPNAARDHAKLLGLPLLRLDEAGARAAARHLEQGERGGKLMMIPQGLAPWHEAAVEARHRRRSA